MAVESAPVAEAAPQRPEPAPRPEVLPATPRETFAAPPPPPPVDLDSALRESGLVMIQTKADRIAPGVEVEEASAPRPRRERRPPPADLNTPLVQVETQKSPGATPES
jgi:ribonuclease E